MRGAQVRTPPAASALPACIAADRRGGMHSTYDKASKLALSLVFLMVAGVASEAAAYRVKPAWRGDSLTTPSTYVVSRGDHSGIPEERDLGVLRWDSTIGTGKWSKSKTVGQENWSSKEDDLIWGMPVYAPMDGTIIGCWREMVDENVAGNMPAGNHVNILSLDESHTVFLGHLMKSSIPDGLCPIATEDVNNDPPSCTGAPTGWKQIKSETRLSAPFPTVRQGDFIGYVGMSGATGGNPHLHMHTKPYDEVGGVPCVGPAEVMEFDEAWSTILPASAPPADSDWTRLSGTVPAYHLTNWMAIWPEPSGIQRGTHALTAATIPAVALMEGGTLGLEGVVAYRASTGDLKVTELEITTTGIAAADTETEAGADRIGIARIGDGVYSVVVAIRNTSTSKLQLLPYNVLSDRTLDKGGVLTSANTISDVAITRSPYDLGVVVASIDSATSDLKVKAYGATVTATDITLDGRDDATSTENLLNVDVATVFGGRSFWESGSPDPFIGVVTAERRANGEGWLRTWEIADDGDSVLFGDAIQLFSETSGLAFSVSDIDVSVVGDPEVRQYAVVSLRHSNDNLYVQTYEIAIDGTLTRMSQWTAGTIDMLASTDAGEYDLAVGVRTSGVLSVLSFSVDAFGTLGRSGTRDLAGVSSTANSIAIDGYWSEKALVTAAIKSDGNLSLGYYYTNYSNYR